MRKIKIDQTLTIVVRNFYTELLINNSSFTNIEEKLDKLIKKYSKLFWTRKKKEYIELLKTNLVDILNASPSRIDYWRQRFDEIIPNDNISTSFHEEIVRDLCYSQLRSLPILPLYKNLNIDACSYCNAQLNVVIDISYYKNRPKKGQVKDRKATFELDHFWAKSKYPFLSSSFFNLMPCCSICNKAKLVSDAKFYLYADTDELDIFEFSLEKESIVKYWKSKNADDLKLEFKSLTADNIILDNHKEIFKTVELYNTQKDIAEELVHKRMAYNKAYRFYLEKDYKSKLFPDQAIINRLLIGNYDKPEDIHKRPMAKFTQDIARQLGLIK